MNTKIKWISTLLFVITFAWGGFVSSAYAGWCEDIGLCAYGVPLDLTATYSETELHQLAHDTCTSAVPTYSTCPTATNNCEMSYRFCVMAQCPVDRSTSLYTCTTVENISNNCDEGTSHGESTIWKPYRSSCYTEANTVPLFNANLILNKFQYSSNQYYTELDKVCYPLVPIDASNTVNKTVCVQKEYDCINAAAGYGDCFKTQAKCGYDSAVNAYVCEKDPFITCSSVAVTAKQAITSDQACQPSTNAGTGTGSGTPTGGGGIPTFGFANLSNANFGQPAAGGGGTGPLCPAGMKPTTSCISNPPLTDGLPAFPPDCCS